MYLTRATSIASTIAWMSRFLSVASKGTSSGFSCAGLGLVCFFLWAADNVGKAFAALRAAASSRSFSSFWRWMATLAASALW